MSYLDEMEEPHAVQSADHFIALIRAKSQRWSTDNHVVVIGILPGDSVAGFEKSTPTQTSERTTRAGKDQDLKLGQ
jgi:hypothetical protein